ncbi:MAG: threonine synthase [Elusimicrobia bacterium]|nr:MAG: threonine synthase [Elusimicrobiota bacterium]
MTTPKQQGLIARWRSRLPVTNRTPIISLLEGDTPLVPAPKIAAAAGLGQSSVYLKIEGANPTGSFKDRGMTLAISKAVEEGARGVICASTGNTAASAAAYAARAGLRCAVLLPAGGVAAGKLSQSLMHGAEVLAVRGNFDEALKLASLIAEDAGWTMVNSTNPYRLEGQKTGAFEVINALGRAPDYQFMPVGNAGNITAYWMGYQEAHRRSKSGLPKMMGWQAAGAAPIVLGRPIKNPKTIASAIRIGDPVSWKRAEQARDRSKGHIGKVSDREILSAYRLLAREEGVFCEPSSATGVAGLIAWTKRKKIRPGSKIVCILTGNGLKDPDTPKTQPYKMRTIPATMAALRRALSGTRRGR